MRDLSDRFAELAEAATRAADPPGAALARRSGRIRRRRSAATAGLTVLALLAGAALTTQALGRTERTGLPAAGMATPAPSPSPTTGCHMVVPGAWQVAPSPGPSPSPGPPAVCVRGDWLPLTYQHFTDVGSVEHPTSPVTELVRGDHGGVRWRLVAYTAAGTGGRPVVCYFLERAGDGAPSASRCSWQGLQLSLSGSEARPGTSTWLYAGQVTKAAAQVRLEVNRATPVQATPIRAGARFPVDFWVAAAPAPPSRRPHADDALKVQALDRTGRTLACYLPYVNAMPVAGACP